MLDEKLDQIESWFMAQAKDKSDKPSFWNVKVGGKSIGTNYHGNTSNDPEAAFDALQAKVKMLYNAERRKFDIEYKTSAKDPNPDVFSVAFKRYGSDKISGMGNHGIYSGDVLSKREHDAILKANDEKWENKIAIIEAKQEQKEQMDILRGELYELKHGNQSKLEKIILPLFEPQNLHKLTGFIHGIRNPNAKVQIAQVPPQQLEEVPENAAKESVEKVAANTTRQFNYNLLMQGVGHAVQAGVQEVDRKIYTIAIVAAQNPDVFETMFNTYFQDQYKQLFDDLG